MVFQHYLQPDQAQPDWEKYPEGKQLKDYWLPLWQEGTRRYIENIEAGIHFLSDGKRLVPLVLGEEIIPRNSYVCSPYSQYIDYALYETRLELGSRKGLNLLASLVFGLAGKMGGYCRFDRVVMPENLLLSTNLYPRKNELPLPEMRDFLIKQYPDRAIVFRSVNESLDKDFLEALVQIGFRPVFSRQVYLISPASGIHRQKRACRIDLELAKRQTDFQWEYLEEPTQEDIGDMLRLYNGLYLDKYSPINPQYTARYLENILRNGIFRACVLRHAGSMVAFTSYFIRDGVMVNPLIGYDRDYPREAGLYRLLTLRTLLEAEKKGLTLNMSSGAAHFKRLRGARPYIEYNLVYDSHLSIRRKAPWRLFRGLSGIVIRLVKKYGL